MRSDYPQLCNAAVQRCARDAERLRRRVRVPLMPRQRIDDPSPFVAGIRERRKRRKHTAAGLEMARRKHCRNVR